MILKRNAVFYSREDFLPSSYSHIVVAFVAFAAFVTVAALVVVHCCHYSYRYSDVILDVESLVAVAAAVAVIVFVAFVFVVVAAY